MCIKFNFQRLLVSFILFLSAFSVQSEQLLPEDEAYRDTAFEEYRQQLLEAVRSEEPESLVTMIDQQVLNGRGKKRGMKQFVKQWEPESIDSEIWSILEPILTMGGAFLRSDRGVEFCAPYVFSHFPDDLDIYAHGVVVDDKVPLKYHPAQGTTNVKMLSYDLLKVQDWVSVDDIDGGKTKWLKVATLNGVEGYVARPFVRSPTDYSACFLKAKNKKWKMISLFSNDG